MGPVCSRFVRRAQPLRTALRPSKWASEQSVQPLGERGPYDFLIMRAVTPEVAFEQGEVADLEWLAGQGGMAHKPIRRVDGAAAPSTERHMRVKRPAIGADA